MLIFSLKKNMVSNRDVIYYISGKSPPAAILVLEIKILKRK